MYDQTQSFGPGHSFQAVPGDFDLHVPASGTVSRKAKESPKAALKGSPPAAPTTEAARTEREDADFKAQLLQLIPHLRAFAFSLARRPGGEDLAQEAMMRAWKARASYQPGTNFKAWLFTILRNQHMSIGRRAWRTRPLDPEIAENTLVANDDPAAREELVDVRNAMQGLKFVQRQALMLVGAAGLSYTQTAAICGCAEGTIKSRVSRARTQLAAILESRKFKPRERTAVTAGTVLENIMAEANSMQPRAVKPPGYQNASASTRSNAAAIRLG